MFGDQEAHGVFISYCKQNIPILSVISVINGIINQNLLFLFLVIIQLKLGFKVATLKSLWVQHYT